jgi:TonB family protein
MTRNIGRGTRVLIGVLLAATVAVAAGSAAAARRDAVYLFLRNNKIYLRIPDGPEYAATVSSPVYTEYANPRAAECTTPPTLREHDEVLQFYKPRKGGEVGLVRLELLVSPGGDVAAVQVLESAGPLALYSVLHAVQAWKFVPGSADDAVAAYCRYEYGVKFVREVPDQP